MARLTRQTMATYRHVLNEILKPTVVMVLGRSSTTANDVKYGMHQVTAASLGSGISPIGPRVLPIFDG